MEGYTIWWFPKIRDTFFLGGGGGGGGDPHNKDYRVLGSILGSPPFMETNIQVF